MNTTGEVFQKSEMLRLRALLTKDSKKQLSLIEEGIRVAQLQKALLFELRLRLLDLKLASEATIKSKTENLKQTYLKFDRNTEIEETHLAKKYLEENCG